VLAAVRESPRGIPRLHNSITKDGKSVTDTFHLYVYREDSSITLGCLDWRSVLNFLNYIIPLTPVFLSFILAGQSVA